eukprot:gene29664-35807_t
MSEEDDWSWWQTCAAAGGVAAAAFTTGKFYQDYQAKQKARQILVKQTQETLKDSTVVITGANTGNGYAAAQLFAEGGAKVIMACRNVPKGLTAAERIRSVTKNPNVTVDWLDLTDLRSIEKFASKIDKCHVLVNNAGEILANRQEKYGVEKTFLSNYLGPWYLTNLLLPVLAQTSLTDNKEVRVVTVGSRAEKYTTLGQDFTEHGATALKGLFGGVHPHQPFLSYSTSKLCTLLFHYELTRQITEAPFSLIKIKPEAIGKDKKLQLSAVAVTPGFTNTNIFKFTSPWVNFFSSPFRSLTLKSAEEGGGEIVHAATTPLAHGKYFGEHRVISPSPTALNQDLAKALWLHTETVLKGMKEKEGGSGGK